MYCANCGNKLSGQAKFCGKCGSAIKKLTEKIPQINKPNSTFSKFNFGKTFLFLTVIITLLFTIIFWLADSFKDDALDVFLGIFVLSGLIGLIATFIIRGIKEESPTKSSQSVPNVPSQSIPANYPEYKGLEGWLTFVGLGLFVMTGYGIYIFLDTLFNNSAYAGTFVYNYDLFNGGLMALFSGYVIYLYLKKKENFKIFYIGLWVYMVLQAIGTYAVVSSYTSDSSILSEYTNVMGRNFWGAAIWVSYAFKSKRVKATFIED